MPELPEVEAVTRRVRRMAVGSVIVSAGLSRAGTTAPQPPETVKRGVSQRRIKSVDRRGKNILVRIEGGFALRVHLRMTGNLTVIPDSHFRPLTARAWFELDDGRALILDDPRALGRITLHSEADLNDVLDGLRPEPLDAGFTARLFAERARGSRRPVKLWLMDQQTVVGLGNIYAAEVLFRTGIHPARQAGKIGPERLKSLHAAIVETLQHAINSAIIAYEKPGGFTEGEVFPVAVYGREGEQCQRCARSIRRIRQGGRSTYFCPGCQK
jgi:formamidopyrimidine-DNA glycosylase